MPIVELHLLEGYGSDEKRRLGEALTDAVRLVVPADPEAVTIMIHEMQADAYYRGRTQRAPARAHSDPATQVKNFLLAMERRDIDEAEAMLDDNFIMYFPGTGPMTRLTELLDWAAPRYRSVKKSYEGIDVLQSAGAASVVYCRGTLSGQWPDGDSFEGIRFIDRFEIVGGKITRQDVWNDIAEIRPI